MRKRIIFALAVLSLIACAPKKTVPEEAVWTLCADMVSTYPQATLQDLYKTCYQDFFGPGHMVTDSDAALAYIREEVKGLKSEGVKELRSEGKDELTGFRHRFVRLDLRRIVLGETSEQEVLHRFMDAANTATPVHNDWAGEWKQIETIALDVHPQWKDAALQEALHDAAAKKAAVHHSESYKSTYKPHYRIIKNEK